jgi:hypothetical protein
MNSQQQAQSYELLLAINHRDVGTFIREFAILRPTWVTVAHQTIVLLFASVCVLLGMEGRTSLIGWIQVTAWSCGLFLLLLPLHAVIQAGMYRMLGARDIRILAFLHNLFIHSVSHKHVLSGREYILVAMMPFLILTGLLALPIAFLQHWSIVVFGTLCLHSLSSTGDWAMLNYVWLSRKYGVYTFDDADERVRYILGIERRSERDR